MVIEYSVPVLTRTAINVNPTSAELRGEVVHIHEPWINVSFLYRGDHGDWQQTDRQQVSEPGEFTYSVHDMDPLVMYEFKAVAEMNGELYQGEIMVFTPGDQSRTTQLDQEWIEGAVERENIEVFDDSLRLSREYALDFDGGGDEVVCGSGASLVTTGPLTIEAWAQADSGDYMGIAGKMVAGGGSSYSGFALSKNGDDRFQFQVGDGGGTTTIIVSDETHPHGGWHHIAGVFDGTRMLLYVDGVLQTDTANGSIEDSGDPFVIGRQYTSEDARWWNGLINEVRLWDHARNVSQIRDDMERRLTGTEYGLVGYWTLNEGSGTLTEDLTNNDNHGDINGARWYDMGYLSYIGQGRGHRVSSPLYLDDSPGASVIHWRSSEEEDTFVSVFTAVTGDDVTIPLEWYETSNGQPIPELAPDEELTGRYLWTKEVLVTHDPFLTPTLYDISVALTVGVPGEPHWISIDPGDSSIIAGQGIWYNATSYDVYGRMIGDVTGETNWSITLDAGGHWDGNVYLSAYAGTWTVTGEFMGFTDEALLTVEPDTPSRIDITPGSSVIEAGHVQLFQAVAYDGFDNHIGDVTNETEWSIDSGAGGYWDDNAYTSEIPGEWTVTGSYTSLVGTAQIIVQRVIPDDFQVSVEDITAGNRLVVVVTLDQDDTVSYHVVITIAEESWEGTLNFTMGSASRDWSALETTGEYIVQVFIDDISRTGVFMVNPGEPHMVSISPSGSQTVTAGIDVPFEAQAYDMYDNLITNSPEHFVWHGMDENGLFSMRVVGSYEVAASYRGVISSTVPVTVLHGSPHCIVVDPSDVTLISGESQVFQAILYDMYDNRISEITGDTHWSVEAGAGGGWMGNVYTSGSPGIWIITASDGELHGNATLRVEPKEDSPSALSVPLWLILLVSFLFLLFLFIILAFRRIARRDQEQDALGQEPYYGQYLVKSLPPEEPETEEIEEYTVSTVFSSLLRGSDDED